jgi:hypothetical protein
MVEVVSRLGGVQAQVMSAAELCLWARIEHLPPEAVQRALWEERSLVKTWAMRGTLHLLPASELLLWQIVPGLDRRYVRPAWLSYFEMTADEMEQLFTAVAEALDGRLLTREELVDEVDRLTGSRRLAEKLRHSWGLMLKPAAFRCRLCFGPGSGRNVRFTNPASWLDGWEQVEQEDAEREVTRRFLAAYGPVTRDVFAQWLSVTRSRAGALIRSLGDEVTPVDVEGHPQAGTRAWALAGEMQDILRAEPAGSVRLLPAFDQYVIAASRDAANLMPGPFRDRIYRPAGWLSPVLLVDGRMDGVWRHERKGKRVQVRIEPFLDVPAWVRHGAEEEAERLANFLGGGLELSWS